jgi:predicted enzyme related to lactoylglutathione lyase
MMFEPSAVVLYVDNIINSRNFYQNLLEITAEELSPTFNKFTFSNGMELGLKTKNTVEPAPENTGSGELAFTLENKNKVDALFEKWQKEGVNIAQTPTALCFGYTFLAQDPDGNRLRVISLGTSE